MKHGLISVAGWAALACWALCLPVALALVVAPGVQEPGLWFGFLTLAAVVLTILWARGRWWWWKNKMRAAAYREGWQEMKEREQREAGGGGRDPDRR